MKSRRHGDVPPLTGKQKNQQRKWAIFWDFTFEAKKCFILVIRLCAWREKKPHSFSQRCTLIIPVFSPCLQGWGVGITTCWERSFLWLGNQGSGMWGETLHLSASAERGTVQRHGQECCLHGVWLASALSKELKLCNFKFQAKAGYRSVLPTNQGECKEKVFFCKHAQPQPKAHDHL